MYVRTYVYTYVYIYIIWSGITCAVSSLANQNDRTYPAAARAFRQYLYFGTNRASKSRTSHNAAGAEEKMQHEEPQEAVVCDALARPEPPEDSAGNA
jgi:hypothetical protein